MRLPFKDQRTQKLAVALLFAVFAMATWLRFHAWEPRLLFADDLYNYMLYHGDRFNSQWAPVFFADAGEKFRFVFSGAMHAEIFLFGKNIDGYLAVNIAVHAVSATLLCLMSFRLCRSWLASILLGAIAVTSRFGLYQVTQVTGQVENLALLFCLLTIYCVMRSDESTQTPDDTFLVTWKCASLLFGVLAFNAHERYIILLPWLAIFFVFHRRSGVMRQRVTFLMFCIALILSNALIKRFIYHSNFFQGTGGEPLSVNLHSIGSLFSEALLSIIGVNHGPQYLTGAEWGDFSGAIRIASVACAFVGICFLVACFVCKSQQGERNRIFWPLWLLILMALLLLPATLTIRMEQRWVLGSYFLFLLLIAAGVGRLIATGINRSIVMVMLICLTVCTAVIEARVSKSFQDIFFVDKGRYAEAIRRAVVDSKSSPPGAPVILVTDPGHCIATLLDGGFFVVYEGMHRKLQCVKSPADASPSAYPSDTRIYISQTPDQFVDVTDQWRSK